MNAEPRTAPPAPDRPLVHGDSVAPPQVSAAVQTPRGWEIWLLRIRSLLFVTLCATFGVFLIILPWTPKWTDNSLLLMHPGLRDFISNGFFRGVVSGLGISDLWLGFWEAIHYHETPDDGG